MIFGAKCGYGSFFVKVDFGSAAQKAVERNEQAPVLIVKIYRSLGLHSRHEKKRDAYNR